MEGFYGFEVHAGHPAVKANVPEGCIFRVMQVALPAGASEPITLRVAVNKQQPPLVLLTLDPKLALYQSSMDSVCSGAQSAMFSAEGAGAVHVCGYIQPAMDADNDFSEDEDDDGGDMYVGGEVDEEDEEDEDVPPPRTQRPKKQKRTEGHPAPGVRKPGKGEKKQQRK